MNSSRCRCLNLKSCFLTLTPSVFSTGLGEIWNSSEHVRDSLRRNVAVRVFELGEDVQEDFAQFGEEPECWLFFMSTLD